VPLLEASDPLPGRPRRVLVAGTAGSGKTTLGRRIAAVLQIPHVEIDALYHGPGWVPRSTFAADVAALAAEPAWVTEWQYSQVRALLASAADLMIWLDLSRGRVMWRVTRRTVQRRLRRDVLWNGNIEGPLRTLFSDPDHIVRWAWRTHSHTATRMRALAAERPELPIVRLSTPRAVRGWVDGPLAGIAAGDGAG